MTDEKKRRGMPAILFILLVLMSAGVYFEVSQGLISGAFGMTLKTLIPGDTSFEYSSEASPVFSWGKDGFLCATKDGAVYYSYKGETLWGVTYTMQRPHVLKKGESWAILEPMGRAVYVCGEKGLLYIASTEYPILNAGINVINCLILILKTDDGYNVRIYNGQGEASMEKRSNLDGIYPTCAAISDDGYTYSVGYIDTTKAALLSRIQYFYTNSGAIRYGTDEQSSFKAIEKPNTVITKLVYGSNGNLASVFDNEIFITTPRGEEVSTLTLSNRLTCYSFGDEMFGMVLGQPFANSEDKAEAGLAEWFDYNGNKISEYPDLPIEQIEVYGKNILLKSRDTYILIDSKGSRIWTFGAPEDIIALIPSNKKAAVVAKAGRAQVYLCKTPKQAEKALNDD